MGCRPARVRLWRDPSRPPDDPQAWLATFAVVITAAGPGLERVHDRMPLVMPRDRWDDWLSPQLRDAAELRDLRSVATGAFTAVPVSDRVNDVRHDGPDLVTLVPLAQAVADTLFG